MTVEVHLARYQGVECASVARGCNRGTGLSCTKICLDAGGYGHAHIDGLVGCVAYAEHGSLAQVSDLVSRLVARCPNRSPLHPGSWAGMDNQGLLLLSRLEVEEVPQHKDG